MAANTLIYEIGRTNSNFTTIEINDLVLFFWYCRWDNWEDINASP